MRRPMHDQLKMRRDEEEDVAAEGRKMRDERWMREEKEVEDKR